jgi:hypothetical protein
LIQDQPLGEGSPICSFLCKFCYRLSESPSVFGLCARLGRSGALRAECPAQERGALAPRAKRACIGLAAGTGPRLEAHRLLQWKAHFRCLQQSKQAALPLELFLVAPGASLARGEASLQQALLGFAPRGPAGLDPSWISLEVQPAFVVPLQGSTTGQRSSALCRLRWLEERLGEKAAWGALAGFERGSSPRSKLALKAAPESHTKLTDKTFSSARSFTPSAASLETPRCGSNQPKRGGPVGSSRQTDARRPVQMDGQTHVGNAD